jgi:hypothetical protein
MIPHLGATNKQNNHFCIESTKKHYNEQNTTQLSKPKTIILFTINIIKKTTINEIDHSENRMKITLIVINHKPYKITTTIHLHHVIA